LLLFVMFLWHDYDSAQRKLLKYAELQLSLKHEDTLK